MKFICLVAFFVFSILVVQSAPITDPTVTFVLNVGGVVQDGTFNEGIYDAALEVTTAAGGTLTPVLSPTADDQLTNLNAAAAAGSDVILAAGFLMTGSVSVSAAANPASKYAMIDGEFANIPNNTVCAVFREDQAGYLAGTLAASVTLSRKVACLGAFAIPSILKYCNGFRAGFFSLCPENDCAAFVTFVPDFQSHPLGAAAANAMLDQGADVIFTPAGGTGSGGLLAAAARQTYGIGVDLDEYFTTFADQPLEMRQYLLSSARKRSDVATSILLQQFFDDTYIGGSLKVFDVNVQGVDLAPCHDACAVVDTPDVQLALSEALLGLKQGILSTSADPSTGNLQFFGSASDGLWDHLIPWGVQPPARSMHSVAVLNGSLVVIYGGYDETQTVLQDAYFCDLSLNSQFAWMPLSAASPPAAAATPGARAEHATALWTLPDGSERMLVFGGVAADGALQSDVWAFQMHDDRLSGGWTRLATTGEAPSARRRHAMGVVGQSLYVFGGIDASVTSLADLYMLDLASLQWAKVRTATAEGPTARDSAAAAGLQGDRAGFYMYGGIQSSDRSTSAQLWYFNPAESAWHLLEPAAGSDAGPPGLSQATLLATLLDGILVFGGINEQQGIISSSLWRYNLFQSSWALLTNVDQLNPVGVLGHAAALYADPSAPPAILTAGSTETRPRYRQVVFGGITRQGITNDMWIYGVEPLPQIQVEYFVCDLRKTFVDTTGLMRTDVAAGVYTIDYLCDSYIDCTNLYDESVDCSFSAEGIFIGFGTLAGLEIVIGFVLIFLVFHYRKLAVMRIASNRFLVLILVGTIWWISSVFTFFGRPTDTACAFRPWWLAVPFTFMYACLFSKEWRMFRLTSGAAKFKQVTVTDRQLALVALVLLVPDFIILIVWMAVDLPKSVLVREHDTHPPKFHYECQSDNGELFFWLLVGYQLILLILGSIQAWRSRAHGANLGESGYIALAIYDLLFLSAFTLPLLYLLQDQPNSLLVIIFIAITISGGITTVLIFAPKLYLIWVKKVRVTSLADFQSSRSRPGSSRMGSFKTSTPGEQQSSGVGV